MWFSSDSARFSKRLEAFARTPVSEIMTRDVMTISQQDNLVEAANIMIGHHISSLVVMDLESSKPLGIITERDYLAKAPHIEDKLKKTKVKDLMTKGLVTAKPSLPVMDANEIMNKHKFRKLVVTEDGKLSGIVTQTDLVRKMDKFYQGNLFRTSDSLPVKAVKQEAVILKTTDKVADAQKKLVKGETGTAFVSDGKKLVGVFTEYDFLSELALQPESLAKQKVGDVMSFPVVAIDSEVDLFDANHLMISKNFRRLPVFDNGKVLGKLSQTIVRQSGYDILNTTLNRVREKELEKVNFQRLKKSKELVRKIEGKIQEFTYAD